ncbi:MAG: polysaccharide deacetylase family protein [Proteobacteria bacterium]|nr:polysaccharide deacetylase family protein [Pseudomonadota bacterium]
MQVEPVALDRTLATALPDHRAGSATTERLLCVVLHDVAPATQEACERIIAALAPLGPLPLTLLAVPRYRGQPSAAAFEAWLRGRADGGDEIALHGYTHVDDGVPRGAIDRLKRRHYTAGEGEFSGLALPEARRRLLAGAQWFRDLGVPLHGFVAPAWLMSDEAWAALAALRLDYTCTLGDLVLLPGRQRIASQSLVYSHRSAWRRIASIVWTSVLERSLATRPLVRLELHPGDIEHPMLRRHGLSLADRLMRDRRGVTFAEAARMLRARLPVRTARTSRSR